MKLELVEITNVSHKVLSLVIFYLVFTIIMLCLPFQVVKFVFMPMTQLCIVLLVT